MQTNKRHLGILLTFLTGTLCVASVSRADDKDLLKSGSSRPNVIVILSNTVSMQYLPYVQGTTPNLPADGQYMDSPVSKFGLAKGAFRAIIQQQSTKFNFGLSWYSYHQESVSHKYWSYQFTTNVTPGISNPNFDYPGDTFQSAVGTYYELGTNGNGPIQTAGNTETFGITDTTIVPGWFGDQPAVVASCATDAACQGFALESINATHRVAVHLVPVGGGQPYGQLSITMVKHYQTRQGKDNWITGGTPAGNPGMVSLTLSASISTVPSFPNAFTTGSDNGLYMGFMRNDPLLGSDWNLNSDCGGWFVKGSLPAIGIPRDYNSDLACSLTTCAQPPEQSVGCVLRYTRPQSSVIHYDPATGLYTPVSPRDDVPGLCSSTVVHTGAGPEDQIILNSTNDSHIPESNMFSNADSYFSGSDCFVNGIRSDDPNKTCRTGAIILLSDTFSACGPNCSQNATAKYLVSLKAHHVPVYVISFGVPEGTVQATEAHCIALTSGSEDSSHQGVFPVTSTNPAQVANDLSAAFTAILTQLDEATEEFASASVSSVQAGNSQMAFLATFNARKNRSIWDGALRGYKLLPTGGINPAPVAPDTHAQNLDGTDCVSTVKDPNDPQKNVTLDIPCNQFPTLRWNVGINLAAVPLVPSNPSGVADLPAGATLTMGATYLDTTNDLPALGHPIPVFNYSGRRILWSLPSTVASSGTLPGTLPINGASAAGTEPVPETSKQFLVPSGNYWTDTGFKFLKLLMTSQTSPPASGTQPAPCVGVACPGPSDISASQTVRFIRGDRDTVLNELRAAAGLAAYASVDPHLYASPSGPLKFGDIFHSSPLLIAEPENVFFFNANLHNYQDFFNKHQRRRRVLYTGANDGLIHAFDVGVWKRTATTSTSACTAGVTDCYDFGTGAELFAYVPRAIAQVLPLLKDAAGPQGKTDEWTVDGAPAAADMFIDTDHSGTPVAANRKWHTVLVGTMREGSAFEGRTPCPSSATTAFQNSASSVYALEVTQPEPSDGAGVETFGSTSSPGCLDGGTGCPAAWPRVLWEIQDSNDADSNGYPDMGESWSKPALGRICVAKDVLGNCTDERHVAIFGGGFDRERLNRRGNWLYIVDVETGFVLYKVNSGVGNPAGGGNVTVPFASIPAAVASVDLNFDGLLDFAYFGDMLGQMWRLDLRDLKVASSPTDRWSSKLQKGDGTALSAFLVFQAPQPVSSSTPPNQYFPIYYQPAVVYIGSTTPGQASVGLAFGTGDRDDITALCDATTRSTAYNQRFYFVVDRANTQTVRESTLMPIATSSTANVPATTIPSAGWYLLMGTSSATAGERLITDVLVVNQFVYFFTQTPFGSSSGGSQTCPPPSTCTLTGGLPRQYTMFYANGNYPLGATDRGTTVPNASFATNPVFYISGDQSGHVAFTTNHGGFSSNPNVQPTQSNVKAWKEN
jgi:Neisseria PilC beta-propeller domain